MNTFDARTRYALLATLDLAERYASGKPVKVREIAARTRTPAKYLVHILLQLKRKALVNSARGPKGGYWLLRPPELISVAEIVGAVGKASPPGRPGAANKTRAGVLKQVWTDAERKRHEFLAHVTLAQLLAGEGAG